MGFYMICVDGGECIIVRADTAEEAGRKARIRFPNAKSFRLKGDRVNNLGPLVPSTIE
ncbi:hypothetical protein LCGC14_0220560 [marine sediment metagenome]|uniref:Uncharacterized protein n=1 Tax=marine sediment metagenome TaxID=412755 RepID=A0A0F9UDC9_9ZZZZ